MNTIGEMRTGRIEKKFGRWRGRTKSKLSFDQWLELFRQDCISFAEISRMVGCTTENIRQLYQKYFARLFPNRPNGRSRQKICALKMNEAKAKDLSSVPESLKVITEIASDKGYTVERTPVIFKGQRIVSFQMRHLVINKKRCEIHRSAYFRKTKWTSTYTALQTSFGQLKKSDFLLAIQETENNPRRVFVIPIPILLQVLEKKGKKEKRFFIPAGKEKQPAYHNRLPEVNFWQYLDAWHLLESE